MNRTLVEEPAEDPVEEPKQVEQQLCFEEIEQAGDKGVDESFRSSNARDDVNNMSTLTDSFAGQFDRAELELQREQMKQIENEQLEKLARDQE